MKRTALAITIGVGTLTLGALGGSFVATVRGQQPLAQRGATGRYQIVISPSSAANTFLLDTETGRVWREVVVDNIEGEPAVFKLQDRVDSDADLTAWARTKKRKTDK